MNPSNEKISAHVMSDIHFEHMNRTQTDDFMDQLTATKVGDAVELVILAGDIINLSKHWKERANRVFKFYSDLYKKVVYLPGNHEFYDTTFKEGWPDLEAMLTQFPNIHLLTTGKTHTIDGVRFIGDTMWFPEPPPGVSKRGLADFPLIADSYGIYDYNKNFVDNCIPQIQKGDIVVTHHMPFEESVSKRFKGDKFNHYFLFDCTKWFTETNAPRAWVHGHTHDPCFYTHSIGTKVVCNPKGYPHENANNSFWDNILVKL